jgi:hypothetical protein
MWLRKIDLFNERRALSIFIVLVNPVCKPYATANTAGKSDDE